MNSDPTAIIDSGIGGLSVYKKFLKLLPLESVIYFADSKYVPYGHKTSNFIKHRIIKIIGFLSDNFKIKLVVLACNTATVAGLDEYRKKYPHIPIIGTVPVIKKAVLHTKTGRIGVISTEYTSGSDYQKSVINKFAANLLVENISLKNIVTTLESGINYNDIIQELEERIGYIKNSGIDTLVLGCTHFALIKEEISQVVGENVLFLDSSGAVSRHAGRILKHEGLLCKDNKSKRIFLTTGNAEKVSQVAKKAAKMNIIFKTITI